MCCQHKARTSSWQISGGQGVRPCMLQQISCCALEPSAWRSLLDVQAVAAWGERWGWCGLLQQDHSRSWRHCFAGKGCHSSAFHMCLNHTHTGSFLLQMLLSLPLGVKIDPRHVQRHVASRTLCLTYILALQVSAFYVSPDPPRYLVRFCFCKADEKLHKACNLLEKYFARWHDLSVHVWSHSWPLLWYFPFILSHKLLLRAFNKIKIFRPVLKYTYMVKDDKQTLCLDSSLCARTLTCSKWFLNADCCMHLCDRTCALSP